MKDSVQTFLVIALVFLTSIYVIMTCMSYEENIEALEQELELQTDSLNCIIDSLMLKIDTLTWENEIWDFNIQNNTTHLLFCVYHLSSIQQHQLPFAESLDYLEMVVGLHLMELYFH